MGGWIAPKPRDGIVFFCGQVSLLAFCHQPHNATKKPEFEVKKSQVESLEIVFDVNLRTRWKKIRRKTLVYIYTMGNTGSKNGVPWEASKMSFHACVHVAWLVRDAPVCL